MVQAENRQQQIYRSGAGKRNTERGMAGEKELQIINVQRNPYLAEHNACKKPRSRKNTRNHVTTKREQVREIDWVNEGARRRTAGGRQTGKASRQNSTVKALPVHQRVLSPADKRRQERSRRIAERRRRQKRRARALLLLGCVCSLMLCFCLYNYFFAPPEVDGAVALADTSETASKDGIFWQKIQGMKASDYYRHPAWTEDFLTENPYSRPGDALKEVNSIFVHYTANKGTSAAQNRSYFEQLKDTGERSASAHFIIGYEGEIIQCVPLDEIAYAVAGRNEDSISIECCYDSEDGSFTQETYDSLLAMLKWLTDAYDLNTEDILRHYDCGGKKCPVYYVENEDAWEQLKKDVEKL